MKILIADDMEENLYLLETLLKGNGYEVVSAKNGVEALQKLKKEPVDMIISDILMPGMDGFQLCSKCKSDDKLRKIPFVFYTATYTDEKSEKFASSLGAQKFIVKPMEPKNFMKIIKDLLKEFTKDVLIPPKIPAKKEVVDYLKGYGEIVSKKLEKKVLDLEKSRDVLKESEAKLKERVKELNCLYGITKIIEMPDISLEGILQKTTAVMPSGWQYPEITCARIILGGQEFKTTNFKETRWKQSADIKVSRSKAGEVEVFYLEEKPEIDEGPFLKEERNLIETIAKRLGSVTERKKAEEALRKSEKKHRALVENLPQKIFFRDKNAVYVSCNENFARDYKIKADEIAGKTNYDFFPKELAEKYRAQDKIIMESGKTEVIEERRVQNGRKTWQNVVKTPVKDEKGNSVGVLGIYWDITERKNAEKAMREFIYKVNDISPGECYLHRSRDAAYRTFAQLVLHGVPGLCISREKPEKLIEYGVLKENVILLSSTPIKGFKAIENLQEISRVISNFLKEHKTPIVLLDGLAYLVSRFDFKPVYKFVQEKRFAFVDADAVLIMPIDLATFSDKERALLTSEVNLLG